MRSSNYAFLVGIGLLAISPAYSTEVGPQAPAAPQVTVGAGLRELIFHWNPVAGAAYYELRANPDGHSGYTLVGDRIPASRTRAGVSISVHLQHWSSARYTVAACNAAGCRNSGPLSVAQQMLDTIGYLKASNTNNGDFFGMGVAISFDGYTLAVSAPGEDSNARGVNGNQANNTSQDSGAVYLFRREGRSWRQEAYLKAGVNQIQQHFGHGYPFDQQALAISGNGELLAVGAPGETVGGISSAGKVYFFGRAANGSWRLLSSLVAPAVQANDYFGISVDLSVDGRTLKVNSIQPQDGEGNPEVRTHVFVRSGSAWTHQATIAPPVAGEFCQTVRLSGDGNTIIANCWGYVGAPTRMVTYKRNGNAWNPTTDLVITSARTVQPVALNYNATRMAFTDSDGLNKIVLTHHWDGAAWVRDGSINPPVPVLNVNTFGEYLVFNGHGNMLVVGDILSGTAGAGVMETVIGGPEGNGAVFVYQRGDDTRPWTLRSAVRAPRASIENNVGAWIALSGSGLTLAVGAPFEDSAATGIEGDQTDNTASESGAVYLY